MNEIDHIKKILERERLARKEAERILEAKSLEIYEKENEIENLKTTLNKQAKKELEIISRKQDLLNSLFKTHPLPIIIISVNSYELIDINNEAATMFGLQKQNLNKTTLTDLCDLTKLKDAIPNESAIDKVTEMQNLNGEKISVKITKINSEYKGAPSFVLIIEDISELIEQKKQSEEQIKLLSLFPELNPSPVLRFSIDQNQLLYANKIGTEFLDGLEHDKDQKRDWLLFLDGKAGVFQEVEWQNKTYRFSRVAYEQYGFINFYSTDITERKALEEKNRDQQQKYQNLIENSSDIIYTIDKEGFFTYMNPTGLKLVGYSLSELKTENFRELVKISFKERVASFYTYQLKNKVKSTYTEFPIQTKDGKEIWLGQNVDMFFANDDVNITVVARDITEKKRLEKEILRSEEKYRSIINNLELGMLEVNNEGIIIKAHPYFCKMVGYTKEEIEGTNGEFMLDHEAIEIMSYQRSQREKGALGLYEIQLISKNGQKIWVMISGAPTYDQHNKIVGSIGIHLNITDQKKLEKELRTAASIAQDSLKSKELFLANISHEMRTPLNGIIGLSELIAGDDDLSENTSLKLKSILESSNNLLNLIDDLLLFTKIENDKIELHEEFTPLKQSLDSLLQTHEISAHTKGISFANNNEIPEQNDYYIDVFRLHQVLNNLIYNAIKFTNEGGVKVNSRVILNSKNYDIIEIEVIDTGIGIPESEIDKIFGSFQQASNNDVKVNGGTGLGLSIVKEIMNLMGGELDLATSNNGTTFVIEFQLNKAIRTDSDSTALNKPERHLAELKVLIAEDNKVNQFVITSMLDRLNIKYVMCNDGLEAIKNFERDDFGLVLMDLRMPNMDGMEATKIMRAKDKNTPIIAVTANTTSVNKNDYLDQGFTDLLSKPFKQKDLLDVLTKHSQKNDLCVTTRLMQLTNEDANFSKQLALIFIEDNAKRGKEIIEALNNENIERINSISHSMKPSILQLGSKELQNLVLDMEKANSKTDSIKNKVFHFVRKLDEMIDDMEKNVVPKLETMS